AAQADLLAGLHAGRDLHVEHLVVEADARHAAAECGLQIDLDPCVQVLAARTRARTRTAAARARAAEQALEEIAEATRIATCATGAARGAAIAEDLAEIEIEVLLEVRRWPELLARTIAARAQAVVGLALLLVAQDLVRLVDVLEA